MSGLKLKERAQAVNKAAVDRGDDLAQGKQAQTNEVTQEREPADRLLLSLPSYVKRSPDDLGSKRTIYYTDKTRDRIKSRTQGSVDYVLDFLINYALDAIENEGVTLTVTRDGKVLRSI